MKAARDEAEATKYRTETGEAAVRTQLAKLELGDRQKAENGSRLFNFYIADPNGFMRGKTKVTIPETGDGKYDFSQLNDEEKVSLRTYLDAKQNASSIELDKLI